MCDEDRIVVVKISIPDTSTGDMSHRVISGQFNNALVARQNAVLCQREALERTLLPQAGKCMRCRATFMVAPLRAHMMEYTGVGDIHFHDLVESRRRGSVFQNGDFSSCINTDNVVQDRIGCLAFVLVLKVYGLRHFASYMDEKTVSGKSCVERCQRTQDRVLPTCFQHAVEISCPVNVSRLPGKPFYTQALKAQIVRGICIEDTVHEHDLKAFYGAENGRFFFEERCRHDIGLGQCIRTSVFPILIPTLRKARSLEPGQRIAARSLCPTAGWHRQRRKPRICRCLLNCCVGHYATSARISP